MSLANTLEIAVAELLPPDQPAPALLRATAERLADSDLQSAIDELVDAAEDAAFGVAELEVTARGPSNAANELLEKAGVSAPPVDVDALAERCGTLVLYRPFSDSLSGLVFAIQNTATIGINELHSTNRRRFSLAHELGHFVLGHHRGSGENGDALHIDAGEGNPPGFDWRAERAANDFAAELLMPRKLMSEAFGMSQDPSELADQFQVSELAMGYRLVNLGLR